MELIFLAIVELAVPLAMASLTLFADLVVIICNLLGLLASLISGSSKPEAAAVPAETAARRAKVRRWTLRIMTAAAGLLIVLLAALAVANAFFFESLTGWAFGQAEKKAGVALKFEKAEGSLWTGEFRFRGLTAQRAGHPRSVFDFRVESAEADISMSALIRQKIVFDRLKVSGVTGSFERKAKGEGRAAGKGNPMKPRRPFVVNDFSLDDVSVKYADQTLARPLQTELKLDHLRAASISSRTFIADLLYRSNAAGSFEGADFTITSERGTGNSAHNVWRCENLSVQALAALSGGPFEWFESGRVDITSDNQSSPGRGTVMNWRMIFRDIQARVPADASPEVKLWGAPVAAYLNSKSDELDLGFAFEIKPGDLEFASTDDLSGLVSAMVGTNIKEALADLGRKLKTEGLKLLLDKGRGRGGEAQDGALEVSPGEDQPRDGRLKSLWKDRKERKAREASGD